MARAKRITRDEFLEAREQYQGYCPRCKQITGEGVEPDAEEYECPICGQPVLLGIETALISGVIEINSRY